MKFQTGQVVITPAAQAVLFEDDLVDGLQAAASYLRRHIEGDWGVICEEDKELNDQSLLRGFGRLMSVYETRGGKNLWVITEADRSCTTLLLPEDY